MTVLLQPIITKIIQEAYSWIGTPYKQGCCVKGKNGGIDCGFFMAEIFKASGVVPHYYKPPIIPKSKELVPPELFRNELLKFGNIVPFKERQIADVITLVFDGKESHVMVLVDDDCVIHAVSHRGIKKQRLRSYKNIGFVYRANNV